MIEKGDINDSEVLSKTRQERGQNDSIRFLLTLPSGREIHSEWIPTDQQKKALFLWIDAAKDQILLDAEESAAAVKRARKPPQPEIEVEEDPAAAHGVREMARKVAEQPKVEDPIQHAKNQVALLVAEEAHWLAEFQRATKHLDTTRKMLRKWQTIVASLDAGESNESEESGNGQ